MRQPIDREFQVRKLDAGVEVTFTPTNSIITYNLLADAEDIKRFGPLSNDPNVRHAGPTGDFGDYPSAAVLAIAHRLAAAAHPDIAQLVGKTVEFAESGQATDDGHHVIMLEFTDGTILWVDARGRGAWLDWEVTKVAP